MVFVCGETNVQEFNGYGTSLFLTPHFPDNKNNTPCYAKNGIARNKPDSGNSCSFSPGSKKIPCILP